MWYELEFVGAKVFENDFAFRLQLQKFEGEAEEVGGFLIGVGAADVVECDGAVDEGGGVEGEAVFFPIRRVVDSSSDDFFDQELGRNDLSVDCCGLRKREKGSWRT